MTDLRILQGEARRPWPRDRFGRELPRKPVRGLRLDVAMPGQEHLDIFERWRVRRVARGRFEASTGLRSFEGAHASWETWLEALCTEGPVAVHLPGCVISRCRGCDGSAIRRTREVPKLRLLP